jgi:hypothetical protein
MTLTLTGSIDENDNVLAISGEVPAIEPGFRFALDNELLTFASFAEEATPRGVYPRPADPQRWHVYRGVASDRASHDADTVLYAVRDAWVRSADLTEPGPFSPSAGVSTIVDVTIPSGSDNLGTALIAAIAALVDPLEVTWAKVVAVCMADPGQTWRTVGYELVWPALADAIVWAPVVSVTANGETIGEGFTATATRQPVTVDPSVAGAVLTLLLGTGVP